MINKVLLFLSCILAVFADMSFVWWAKSKEHSAFLFLFALLLSLSAITIWSYSMFKGIESAMAITVYALLTVAGCTALGYLFLND